MPWRIRVLGNISNTNASMPLATGTRLGRYEIRSLLGAGGMGEVYLALDTRLRRPVALKLLPVSLRRSAA